MKAEASEHQSEVSSTSDATRKMVTGSAWMTAGSITSRILGALYVIPWVTWMGVYSDQANAAYAKGYNIYQYFIILASAGIPSAISQMVADYNGRGQYLTSKRLYRSAMYVAMITGIFFMSVMYFGAGILAQGDANVVPVIRALAWAILIIPAMSISRGYLQGYNWMAPSAISQFIEQLLRVGYMLGATYFVMKIGSGNWVSATAQSTFAAFIGAIGACLVLLVAELRERREIDELVKTSHGDQDISTLKLIGQIIYRAIPFIIIESGISLFLLIDQYTFPVIMHMTGTYTKLQVNTLYALFAFNTNKIYMIIVSLGTALAATAIPLLASARAKNNLAEIQHQIEKGLLLFYFVMIPASLGLSAVAQPVYTAFYRYSAAGTAVMSFAAFMSIPYGVYTVAAAMMQGISENKKMMTYLGIGIIIKFILQYPFVKWFTGLGPLLSTAVAMLIVIGMVYGTFHRRYGVHFSEMTKPTNQIIIASLIMYVIVRVVMWGIGLFISPYGRYTAFFSLVPGVAIGGIVFAYLVLKLGVAEYLLGPRINGLKAKLHIK